jgi:hypothetical protein
MKRKLYSAILAAAVFAAAADTYAQSNVYSVSIPTFAERHIEGPVINRSFLIGPKSSQIGFQETRWGSKDGYHFTFVHTYSNSTSTVCNFTFIAVVGGHPFRFWIQPWIAGLIIVLMTGLVIVPLWRWRRRKG